jgi:hypothetical protein
MDALIGFYLERYEVAARQVTITRAAVILSGGRPSVASRARSTAGEPAKSACEVPANSPPTYGKEILLSRLVRPTKRPVMNSRTDTGRLYERVAQDLSRRLRVALICRQRLPSERDLASAYEVSRPTIREA